MAPPPSHQPGPLDIAPSVVLAAAGAVLAFLAFALAVAPPPTPLDDLTFAGAINVMPEHEVTAYLGLGAAFFALVVLLATLAGRGRRPGARSPKVAMRRAAVAVVGAGGALLVAVACFANARNRLPQGPRIRPWELALLAGLAVASVVGAWALAPGRPSAAPAPAPARPPRTRWHVADFVVPLLVVAVVYVPGWHLLAGNAFMGEEFLHIDFFAIGPALAFKKGVALGTELHVYYGMGWALVLAKLPLVRTLTHGHFIRLEMIYGCVYFIAVYGFLRLFTRSWKWATAGTSLAILLQLFGSYSAAFVMWRFPSATVLRWAFDVWFFLACLLYLRTRRVGWLVLGGLLTGLALLFQTDAGMYLAAAAGFFWICLWRMEPGAGRRLFRTGAAAAVLGVSVLTLGLGIASRWNFLSGAFRHGWLENLRFTRLGATLQPLTAVAGRRVPVFFAAMMATYLIVAGYAVFRFVHRRLTGDVALLGSIAVYGFLTLLYFVGRSNPHNLFRPAVPFAILLAGVGAAVHAHVRDGTVTLPFGERANRRAAPALPWLALTLAVVMLLAHPGFREYPSVARTAVAGSEPDGRCMFRQPADVCGLEPPAVEYADHILALADRLDTLGASARDVAILDSMGPLLYRMVDTKPWGRYVPLFPGLFFKSMLHTVVHDLEASPPDIVVMRSPELRSLYHDDMWQALRPTVERGYTRDSGFGPFEVWQRRDAGFPSGRERGN